MSTLQKIIQHQVGVKSSLYANELGASNSKINNTNSGKKHNSYQRRLNELKRKKKDNLYARQYITPEPLIGNKTESYEIVSRGLTPENFLNCSFNEFINKFGPIQLVYDNFTSFTDYPKTLTLTELDISHSFSNDLNLYYDISFDDPDSNELKFEYGTYNSGTSKYVKISKAIELNNNPNDTPLIFYIDFKINTIIGELTKDKYYCIFEAGAKFRGTSLMIYIDSNNNDAITLDFYSGSGKHTENSIKSFSFSTSITDLNERHLFIAYFNNQNISSGSYYEIYLDNQLLENGTNTNITWPFINATANAGFGIIHTQDKTARVSVHKTKYGMVVPTNTLNITGEVKLIQNTYDELVRSNYFSVNQ